MKLPTTAQIVQDSAPLVSKQLQTAKHATQIAKTLLLACVSLIIMNKVDLASVKYKYIPNNLKLVTSSVAAVTLREFVPPAKAIGSANLSAHAHQGITMMVLIPIAKVYILEIEIFSLPLQLFDMQHRIHMPQL
jgi:hypothetical protein